MVARCGRFPPEDRLRTPADFKTVFDSCHRSSDAVFVVLARLNGLDRARLGLAISAKRLSNATARNSVKRVIRESFRLHHGALRGLDIVVMVQGGVDWRDRQRLRGSIERHWGKLAERCARSS